MNEQVTNLSRLESRYREEVATLEQKLNATKKKLEAVMEVMSMLEQEIGSGQAILIPNQISSKYEKMKMGDAILEIIKSANGKKVQAGLILESLLANGFSSKSMNLKRDLYTRLHRFERKGTLGSRKEGKFKKYYLKEHKTEEIIKKEIGQ